MLASGKLIEFACFGKQPLPKVLQSKAARRGGCLHGQRFKPSFAALRLPK